MMRPLAGVRHAEGRTGTARGNAPQSGRIHPLHKTTLTVAAGTSFYVPIFLFKRDAFPDDVEGTVVFLASDDSAFMSGQTLVVDGGSVFSTL